MHDVWAGACKIRYNPQRVVSISQDYSTLAVQSQAQERQTITSTTQDHRM